jgi:hypothetical protein
MSTRKATQIVAKFDQGALVVLMADGSLAQQVRGKWEPIEGIEGQRIVNITARPNGTLVAVTAKGEIHEHYRSGAAAGDYTMSWRPLPLPEDL